MTHEMVKRVAKALATAREQNGGPPFEAYDTKYARPVLFEEAKAAIEAMRDLYKCIPGPLGNSSNDVILNGTIDIILKE